MKILRHYLSVWKKTFDYSSRSTRAEYWSFVLINSILLIILVALSALQEFFGLNMEQPLASVVLIYSDFVIIYFIAIILPSISVTVRRLHDIDLKGWWALMLLIPYAGSLIIIVCALNDGTTGDNRFGADPKNRRPKKSQPQTERNGGSSIKILQHYLNAWKKTFDYSSRSTRAEFWSFAFINPILYVVLFLLTMMFDTNTPEQDLTTDAQVFLIFLIAYFIAAIFPTLSLRVRRLHDIDFRGWWILIQFIPLIGSLVMLIFALMDGTVGDNRFGADPKGREKLKTSTQK